MSDHDPTKESEERPLWFWREQLHEAISNLVNAKKETPEYKLAEEAYRKAVDKYNAELKRTKYSERD